MDLSDLSPVNILVDVAVDLALYQYVAKPLAKSEVARTTISVVAWYFVNPIINNLFKKPHGKLP